MLHEVALDDALDQQEHKARLFPGWGDPHIGLPMGAANLHHTGNHLALDQFDFDGMVQVGKAGIQVRQMLTGFIRSCKPRGNLSVTAVAVGENALRLYLPTMDLGQQPHPGKNLRQTGRQREAVGDIMIPTRTTLELEPSALQSTPACCTQAVSFFAIFLHRWMAASRDGTHQRGLPSAVRAFIACWRSRCHLWGTDQQCLEELCCRDRVGAESLVLLHELLFQTRTFGGGEHPQVILWQSAIES